MADLKSNTTIGGKLVWNAANLPLTPRENSLHYNGYKIYTEFDPITPEDVGTYSAEDIDSKLGTKVDKVAGKQLSANDFSAAYKKKLDEIETGAQVNVATNLILTRGSRDAQLQSTTGNTITIPEASTDRAGLITAYEKIKLNALPSVEVSGLIPIEGGGTGANSARDARENLGLGNHSTHNYGALINTVMMGNDTRVVNAIQKSVVKQTTGASTTDLMSQKVITDYINLINTSISTNRTQIDNKIIDDVVQNSRIKQTTGTSSTDLMSQKVITDQLALKINKADQIDIGKTALTARTALLLGNHSTHNYGALINTVMMGNDTRVVNATPNIRKVNAGVGLKGGGDFKADRTIAVDFGTTAGKVVEGNDSRLVGAASLVYVKAELYKKANQDYLGNAASHNYGTAANTIAMGNDSRIVNAVQKSVVKQAFGISSTDLLSQKFITDEFTKTNNNITSAVNDFNTTISDGVVGNSRIKQTTGQSTTDVMSQKVTTDQLSTKVDKVSGFALSSNDYTATEKSKLAGIENNSTKNQTDSYLLDRTKHTGFQPISTITGLQADLNTRATKAQLGNAASHNYGTAANTIAMGNDSRIVNAVQSSLLLTAGTGLSGGGNLTTNRTFNVIYGTTAGTATQGNDSRVVNAVQTSRNIATGTGIDGGGNLSANRTFSIAAAFTPQTATLLSTQNLNDIQTPGFYYQNANANSTAARNYPSTNAGTLVVTHSAGVVQEYTTYGPSNQKYIRGYYNGWSAWKEVFVQGNSIHGALTVTGTVYGNSTANFTDVHIRSDKRDKKNIKVISNALSKVNKLTGNTYQVLSSDGYLDSAGLIAQEVLDILPEAIGVSKNCNDEERYSLIYNAITGLLVESTKELTNKVEVLEDTIESLFSMNKRIIKEVETLRSLNGN